MSDEQILKEMGMEAVSDEARERFINQVRYTVETRIMNIIAVSMDDEKLARFEEEKKKSSSAAWQWLNKESGGLSGMYEATLKDYLQSLKERTER